MFPSAPWLPCPTPGKASPWRSSPKPRTASLWSSSLAAGASASDRAACRVVHGWEGATTIGISLAKPYDSHGKTIAADVVEVRWTATGEDKALPEAWHDEFVLRGTTPIEAGPLWLNVLQTCENGLNGWWEAPASGSSTKGLKAPAALLESGRKNGNPRC